jgi:predicted RNA binding protein YcfA (HicA-like mRNA interferase family)
MCVTRKVILRILNEDGWKMIPKMQTSHSKFQKRIDGNLISVVFSARREYSKKIVKSISKETGIPFERFIRSSGSKKHQSGIGTALGLFRGISNLELNY